MDSNAYLHVVYTNKEMLKWNHTINSFKAFEYL